MGPFLGAAAVVESCNTILCVHSRLEHTDVTIVIGDVVLYDYTAATQTSSR